MPKHIVSLFIRRSQQSSSPASACTALNRTYIVQNAAHTNIFLKDVAWAVTRVVGYEAESLNPSLVGNLLIVLLFFFFCISKGKKQKQNKKDSKFRRILPKQNTKYRWTTL